MRPMYLSNRRVQGGLISVLGIEFLAIFAGLSVALVAVANMEVQKADNDGAMAEARIAAESGLALCTQLLLSNPEWSAGPQRQDLLNVLGSSLAGELGVEGTLQESTDEYGTAMISIPQVPLGGGQSFSARLFMFTDEIVRVMVIGSIPGTQQAEGSTLRRCISMDFAAAPITPFEYGMYVNGPIIVGMNLDFRSVHDSPEASLYSASGIITIGSGYIDGDVCLSGDDTEASIGATVNGDVYSEVGEPLVPRIDVSVFEKFATNIVDSNTPTMSGTFTNIRIKAGTNPVFGSVTVLGVVFVEAPNYVDFGNSVDLTGVVVTEDPGEGASLDTHKIEFKNTLTMRGVEDLPDTPEFAELRTLPGTSFLCPGFKLEFKNNFDTISGTMLAEAIESKNNMDAVLYGTIIVLGDGGLTINNNATMTVDTTKYTGVPPGFIADAQLLSDPAMQSKLFLRRLEAKPDSYEEVTDRETVAALSN